MLFNAHKNNTQILMEKFNIVKIKVCLKFPVNLIN
jgi:hypothetical protein